MQFIITDGHGYWCGTRHPGGRRVDFWSSKKRDGKRISMLEAAVRIAKALPMPTRLVTVAERSV